MSNINFLMAYVILFSSHTKITFSQRDATKIKSKRFSEFGLSFQISYLYDRNQALGMLDTPFSIISAFLQLFGREISISCKDHWVHFPTICKISPEIIAV